MPKPVVQLKDVGVKLPDGRRLWQNLNLSIEAGEFLVVLGPNGAGKTTLLQVLLGLVPVRSGSVKVAGQSPHRGNSAIGYIPQQGAVEAAQSIRGRDLVALGLNGHQWGVPWPTTRTSTIVDRAMAAVGAQPFADQPLSLLSGGERQRLRIAQAIVGDPQLLLCDEPLSSLDLGYQQTVSQLIDERRRTAGTAVMLVTHDINPVLSVTDRILYLVGESWAVGKPEDILTTATLTRLYGAPVEVLHLHGRVLVVSSAEAGAEGQQGGGHHHQHHDHAEGMGA
jgi:zinc/manganese transport system ATP-binding protein